MVHEGHTFGAMRQSFNESSEALRSALHRLPAADTTISDEIAERQLLGRRLEGSRVRIAQLGFHSWKVRFLTQVWSAWRLATSNSLLKTASKSVKKVAKDSKLRERKAVAEQAEETRRAREEAKRHARALTDLTDRLDSARSKEDAARSGAATATLETQAMGKRLKDAEAEAAARAGEAKLATEALEKARQLEALWYEQREALLDESEALRQELELAGKGETAKAAGRAWRKRANELEVEVAAVSKQADEARIRAEELQLQLGLAVQEVHSTQAALEALERQRQREKAMAEAAKPPEVMGATSSSVALATGGGCWSPSGRTAAFSGNAEGLSVHLHGASWLVEAKERQARAETLEAEAARWKEQIVRVHAGKVRARMQLAVWHAWWGLVAATRKRQAEKLSKMAEQIVQAASGGPAGAKGVLGPGAVGLGGAAVGGANSASPPGRSLPKLMDHSEWWERKSPTKKTRAPKSPLKLGAMV